MVVLKAALKAEQMVDSTGLLRAGQWAAVLADEMVASKGFLKVEKSVAL